MQVRSAVELIFNFAWRKTFVSNDDTFIDIVVSYKPKLYPIMCSTIITL